jgi:hypothetical protein
MNELIDLEQQGWKALSTEGDAGQKFYASVLREDAVMLLPGGMRIDGRESILQSLASQPWGTFEMESPHVVSLTPNAGTLVYRVTAHRKGNRPYVALVSSTYVLDQEWKLVVHQQTPV